MPHILLYERCTFSLWAAFMHAGFFDAFLYHFVLLSFSVTSLHPAACKNSINSFSLIAFLAISHTSLCKTHGYPLRSPRGSALDIGHLGLFGLSYKHGAKSVEYEFQLVFSVNIVSSVSLLYYPFYLICSLTSDKTFSMPGRAALITDSPTCL